MAAVMTGWEIDATVVDAILNEDHQTLRAFIDGYGRLAAYDDQRRRLPLESHQAVSRMQCMKACH